MLIKRMDKKLDSYYTRMLRAILYTSWRQLYGHLPPISKTIQVRRARHTIHYWRSRGALISDILLWTPSHARAKARRESRIYILQLCVDTGCSLENLPRAMDDRERWRKNVKEILAGGAMTWWNSLSMIFELLEIERFYHLTVCINKISLQSYI